MSIRTAFTVRADGTLAVFQRAEDILDYAHDYAELLTDGDTIATCTWAATGTVTLSDEQIAGSVVSVAIAGTGGSVTSTVTTTHGRRKSVSFCVLAPAVAACT